jgi:RimJ/RimL family protein N-acetyltransferase
MGKPEPRRHHHRLDVGLGTTPRFGMNLRIERIPPAATLALRVRLREEVNRQIVHDSIHRREGWTNTYGIFTAAESVGFASVAVAGPWKDRPTVIEFYLLPAHRPRAFEAFEQFLQISGATHFEAQTNEPLYPSLVLAHGRDLFTEKIIFETGPATTLPSGGATLRRVTSPEEIRGAIERRQGGGEWILELEGNPIGKGGILFHYNRPYGDVYMEIEKSHRRHGFGSYFVQELRRACFDFGAIPAARCNADNVASRRTLQRAGFIPVATMLCGVINLP